MALAIYIAIAIAMAAIGFFGKRNPDGEEAAIIAVIGVLAAIVWPLTLAAVTLVALGKGAGWLLCYFHRKQWEWRDRRKHLL